MRPLNIVPIELKPRTEEEQNALRSASGVDVSAEHATRVAIVSALAVMLVLVVTLLAR